MRPKLSLRLRPRMILRRCFGRGVTSVAATAQTASGNRQYIYAFYQRVEIRRIPIDVVGGEYCLVSDENTHARIGEDIRLGLSSWSWRPRIGFAPRNRRSCRGCSSSSSPRRLISLILRARQRFSVKLIDRFAHFAQLLAQLLFLLSLCGNLNQR